MRRIGRQSTAGRLASYFSDVIGAAVPLRLRAWDGSEAGPADAPAIVLRKRRALRRLIWRPDEVGLARAYVAGDLDVDGDLERALALPLRRIGVTGIAEVGLARRAQLGGVALAARLGAIGPPPAPPPEEAHLSGRQHSKRRDRAAVTHHYDVGNDFYRLLLGPTMVYSCGYWERPPARGGTLEQAQAAKVDLVCRKLDLQPGQRLLDVGCGWGSLVLHAGQHYGVRAVGITLSQPQADLARKRVAEAGLSHDVDIRVADYRDLHDGPYDAVASVGMAEHVGRGELPEYAGDLFALVRPGGRLLNHAIAARPGTESGRDGFIRRYIFPDGELVPVGEMVQIIEAAGFEVRDVEALRENYALTLRAWRANLEDRWAEALRLSSPGRVRAWRLYLAACAVAFDAGRIGVNQVLAVRRYDEGRSGQPLTRRPPRRRAE